MQSRSPSLTSLLGAAVLIASSLVASCGGGDGTSTGGSISLSVSPTSGSVQQGGSLQVTGTITRSDGFTGNVSFAVTGSSLPAGLSGSASNIVTSGDVTTATITLATTSATPAGTYQITVTGSGSGVTSSSVTFSLTVTAAPVASYTLSVNPATVSVVQGNTATTTVSIARTNFTGAVTLAVEGLPSGVTASFNPASPVTANSTVLTLTATGTATTGVSTVTIRGTTPGQAPENTASAIADQTVTLQLTVTAASGTGNFTLSATPATLSFAQGAGGTSTVNVNRTGGFTGNVALAVTGAPANMTASLNPTSTTGNTSTLTVTTTATVAPGSYTLTITGTFSGLANQTTTIAVTVTSAGSYTLSATPTTLSLAQGAGGTSTININRTGGFTGSVALAVTGAPANMTASMSPTPTTANSSTLTITTTAAVAAGNYTLTITGTFAGLADQTTTVAVTITSAGNYTLSATPTTLSFAQGAGGTSTININRTGGFAGSVALAVTGAPANMTATMNPTSTTTNSSTLTITTTGSVATGNYTLTITGTATGLTNQTTTVGVTVSSSGGGGNVTVDFSACAATARAIWFAGNSNGTWTAVTGVNNVYSFSVSGGKGGYAYVTQNGTSYSLLVFYLTQTELTSGTINICGTSTPPAGKTIMGSVTGPSGFTQSVSVSLGGATATASQAQPNFTLQNVADGSQDLVAWMNDFLVGPSASDRGLFMRAINPPNLSNVGVLNMTGGSSFAAATATATLTGLSGGETVFGSMSYLTGAACQAGFLYSILTGGASMTITGVPAGQQQATDFHQFTVSASTTAGTNTSSRFLIQSFHTLANRAFDMGPGYSGTVTSLGGTYKRLQVVSTVPAVYQTFYAAFIYYNADASRSVTITASPGWIGGSSLTLGLDDFSGLAGWLDTYAPASGAAVTYSASVGGFSGAFTTFCSEGAILRTSAFTGQM